MLMSILGVTITKSNCELNIDDVTELNSMNIGVKFYKDKYLLHYLPNPSPSIDDNKTILHLKGLLTRVRSDYIYENYNNDFGFHKNQVIMKVKN